MADFVAVIRRAVDGLSDNTPEMRVKVYDRARGAVQRQLESMKPRPPETMLQRQLEKLEAAIRDVEAEHAEAGVAPEVSEGEAHGESQVAHQLEPEQAVETVQEAERQEEPTSLQEPLPEPVPVEAEEPAVIEPSPVHHDEAHLSQHDAPTVDDSWRAEDEWQAEDRPQPADKHDVAEPAAEPAVEHDHHGGHLEPVAYEPVYAEWQHEQASETPSLDDVPPAAYAPAPDAVAGDHAGYGITETHSDPVHADRAGHFDDVWTEVATPGAEQHAEPDAAWQAAATAEHPTPPVIPVNYPPDVGYATDHQPVAKMPEASESFGWEAATFDDLPPATAKAATEVAPAKQPLPTPAGAFDDVDLFADVHGGPVKQAEPAAQPDGWNEIKELSGYEKFAAENDFGEVAASDMGQVSVAGLQGKSYRMEPKRRRFGPGAILLSLAGVAIVAGGGYAAWMNRTALNDMVAGLVSSAPKNAAVTDKAATPAATTPAATKPTATASNDAPPVDDGNTVNGKFTQRLMADGSEVDAGVPPAPGGPVAAEGKSIAQQNVAAATPAPGAAPVTPAGAATTAPSPTPASPAPATTSPSPQPTATVPAPPAPAAAQTAPVGTGEKMFLYEERLGQTSPTVIEGTVTWSVQEEKGDDGKPSPSVQGSINVPERGLTALVTFKRNSDPSLPASHLIELVFSLPPNFEGGAIGSVQRVAMKQTEQDRGDPLIGVPAKITDDFHMVALNDFPDARKTNLDLLRNRSWIDIPITYRNGRSALLTMDKGKTGTDAFNRVIGEWAAIGGDNASGQ